MSVKFISKGAIKVMALVCAFASQSLFSNEVKDGHVISGVQGQVEYLGTKATRDIDRTMLEGPVIEDSLITVASVKKSSESPLQFLAKSASYNPATPFFRTGLNLDVVTFSSTLRANSVPPDTNGAIGPEQYIVALNSGIRSFDRKTGLPDGVIDAVVANFFGINATSDPHILYDHFAKVWYLVAMSRDAIQGIDIVFAVSHDCVITDCTEWDFFRVPGTFLAPGSTFPGIDYPMISYDSQAVYITINVWTTGFVNFIGPSLCVFQKKSLLAGNPLMTLFPIFYVSSDPNVYTGFVFPVINYDRESEYGYLIHGTTWFNVPQIYNYLAMFRVLNPGSTSPTLSSPINIQVPPFIAQGISIPHQGNLFPSSNLVDCGPSYICNGVARKGQLFASYGNEVDINGPSLSPDRWRISWTQMDLSGDSTGCSKFVESPTTVPAVVQKGTIEDTSLVNPKNYWMSSIGVNALLDLVITGSTSAADEYINAFYSARKRSDPLNTLRNPILVTDTTIPYNFGAPTPSQRWGDYSSVFVDPCNDINFWLTNEVPGVENGWGIRATELIRLK